MIDIDLYGSYSGYNLTIDCGEADECNLYCWDLACFDLSSFKCNESITACSIDCDNSARCELCPNGYEYDYQLYYVPSKYNFPVLNYDYNYIYDYGFDDPIEISTYNDSVTNCDDSSSVTCDDLSECASSSSFSNTGSICCRSQSGCNSITSSGVTSTNGSIRCDGESSCSGTYTTAPNIYCAGDSACTGGIRQATTAIFCTARESGVWRIPVS